MHAHNGKDSSGKHHKPMGATMLFEKLDADHSGQVSFKEFLVALIDFSGADMEDEE